MDCTSSPNLSEAGAGLWGDEAIMRSELRVWGQEPDIRARISAPQGRPECAVAKAEIMVWNLNATT